MRLAFKFIIVLLSATLVLLAAYAYVAYQQEVSAAEAGIENEMIVVGRGLRDVVRRAWENESPQRAMEILDSVNRAGVGIQTRWVWLEPAADPEFLPKAPAEFWQQVRQLREATIEILRADGQLERVTYLSIGFESGEIGAIEISRPLTHRAAAQRSGLVRLMLFGGAALLLGGVLVLVLGDMLVGQPLKLLLEKTRRIGTGDLSKPLQLGRKDEFGELASAINAMCEELQTAQEHVQREHGERLATLGQLRHADRLRTVGRLAAGIAHELGTPLNVVSGRAGLIASGQLAEEQTRESAVAIKKEVDRITRIIRELLDFARRSTPKKTDVDLRQLVRETLQMVQLLAQKQQVTIQLSDNGPILTEADRGQIQQVFSNLLINALHVLPDGGTIQLELSETDAQPPEDVQTTARSFVRLDIRDNGPGIAADVLPQIFEPFFTTKDVGGGTGLGLSIAYGIVQEHGGWIEVESAPGQGARFSVFLPALHEIGAASEVNACPDES